ncbi:hypothetical protein PNK_2400 [Candidatus Protochlamydia naegleriophila]|uniref:Uncharacterized protein n=1 Tax=Candidatus Protochlamydia naegleriophila TaxID=389348 RepID=A0A0U5K740_9BACT|nr:hypothetical protein [Candidatus Protochlamydia naegleriophila]CUI17995.1 hypothetical protein PNK_2400 [Candidatus Protochlamydia naegleriophila]
MNVSPIDTHKQLNRDFELLLSTKIPPLDNQIPLIAKGVALYAQAFFHRLPLPEQQKVMSCFDEWGDLREMNVESILPNLTLKKVSVLKELIQQLSGCSIVDMGVWSMRPLYLFTVTSSQKSNLQISESMFNELAGMQQSESVMVMVLSQDSWNFLNSWLVANRHCQEMKKKF